VKLTRTLRAVMTAGSSLATDKLFDKIKPGLSGKLQDPLRLFPQRQTITRYEASGPTGDSARRSAGYQSSLMGISRFTG